MALDLEADEMYFFARHGQPREMRSKGAPCSVLVVGEAHGSEWFESPEAKERRRRERAVDAIYGESLPLRC